MVAAAVEAVGRTMEELREGVLKRQAVVSAFPELRERELIKRAKLAAAMADALLGRGVHPVAAQLGSETGAAVFHVAFERWVGDEGNTRELAELVRDCFAHLRALATVPVRP
jgi:hypothetical protein